MNGQEFATAVQYDLAIIVLLMDKACTAPSGAPEARIPQPRDRNRVAQSGLRGLRARFGGFGAKHRDNENSRRLQGRQESGKPAILHLKSIRRADQPGDHAGCDSGEIACRAGQLTRAVIEPGQGSRGKTALRIKLNAAHFFAGLELASSESHGLSRTEMSSAASPPS